jgi:benzoylformate decarboxylase
LLGDIFAPDAKVIHIDLNAYEIAKNHPVDLGVVADPKTTLAQLKGVLERVMSDANRSAAQARTAKLAKAKEDKLAKELADDQVKRDEDPLQFSRFMEELAPLVPEDVVIFDEALTSSPPLTRYLPPTKPGHFFQTRGGSLGVGFPGAIGLKLAYPDKTVIGFAGDGGSMYTIQALWSAARHNLDVKFVVCNNRSYKLLQLNIDQYWSEQNVPKHDYPMVFDLSLPATDFAGLAQAMGVQSVRIEKPDEVASAVQQMMNHEGPFLIDVVIESDTHPERLGRTPGQ